MDSKELVPLLVHIPNRLRVSVRIEAARTETTIARFVTEALERAVNLTRRAPGDAAA